MSYIVKLYAVDGVCRSGLKVIEVGAWFFVGLCLQFSYWDTALQSVGYEPAYPAKR